MTKRFVFVAEEGLDYDGSTILGVYDNLDAAKKAAEATQIPGRWSKWQVNNLGVVWFRRSRGAFTSVTKMEVKS